MVQGCEQAAFSIEHQRWHPELPAPEPLAPVPLEEILAQLKGEHMATNIAAVKGKFKNGGIGRLATVPVSFILQLGFPPSHPLTAALGMHLRLPTVNAVTDAWITRRSGNELAKVHGWTGEAIGDACRYVNEFASQGSLAELPFLTLFRNSQGDFGSPRWFVFDGCHRAMAIALRARNFLGKAEGISGWQVAVCFVG